MSMTSTSEKRCLYAVLELSRDCTADEVRSAYRRLALERHPDKLVRSGVPEAEATAAFQELVDAYEILFDPRERAWYDSHRIEILFPDLSSFCTRFKPLIHQYDAVAGLTRKSRWAREEENKKLMKKARREYKETGFVKKRDKRVIDMQKKRRAEMEKKREEEKQRKEELEREKARNYEEAEWARVHEVEDDESEDEVEEKRKEFYCQVCSKKFKSDKPWWNHEQSKKHKEKVAELSKAFRSVSSVWNSMNFKIS